MNNSLTILLAASVSFATLAETSSASETLTLGSQPKIGMSLPLSASTPVVRKNGKEWTTFGHIQPFEGKLEQPTGNGNKLPAILALTEPLSDSRILPTQQLTSSAYGQQLELTAAQGEYEAASLVIQSGQSPLENISVRTSPLESDVGDDIIPPNALDIRSVKVWHQAASQMRRSDPKESKQFVPELLLHDDSLVDVDETRQLNLVRTWPAIADAAELQPFNMPANTNKQMWLTLRVPESARPGQYRGNVSIHWTSNDAEERRTLELHLTVLPFQLDATNYRIGMFYLGRLTADARPHFSARAKNATQMENDFRNMQEHGVNLIGLDHHFDSARSIQSLQTLRKTATLVRKAGIPLNELVYVDWAVTASDSVSAYETKVASVTAALKREGIGRIGIYNADEKKYGYFIKRKHTFETAHRNGAFNIVALTNPRIALNLGSLLDMAVLQHNTPTDTLTELVRNGTTPLAYGVPHAAEEKPATVRFTYGFGMALKPFGGVFSYAYQAGECWDDWYNWDNNSYRANCMTYPTTSTPIPTLQWEAFREAVDDLRYLETCARLTGTEPRRVLTEVVAATGHNADAIRDNLIERIKKVLNDKSP